MLMGGSTNTLDSKGRLVIPVKWRADLTDHIIILYGFGSSEEEHFLQLMSRERFLDITREMDNLHPTDTTFIKAMRFILPNAEELTPDKQGRVLIPQKLLKYAQINGEVFLSGMSNRIEVWDPELYRQACEKYDLSAFNKDMIALADKSRQGGLK